MGLRDRFRSRRPDDARDGEGGPGGAPPDAIDFRPRFDGSYVSHDGGGVSLRFSPATVLETGGDPVVDGPARGEYTSSGRFVVQRPFGRAIVYTVLTLTDDGFSARRTDTNAGGAAVLTTFRFEPTVPA